MKSKIVKIEGVGAVLFEKSVKAKNVNISVRPHKGIRVAVPLRCSFAQAEKLVGGKIDWMKKFSAKMKKAEEQHKSYLESKRSVNLKKVKNLLIDRLEYLAAKFHFKYSKVSIRQQKTRWGSCSGKQNINLNAKLAVLPPELRDYVILHELVHTRVKNHGKSFWQELSIIVPNAKSLDKRLKKFKIGFL